MKLCNRPLLLEQLRSWLELDSRPLLEITGPSGSGKSTLLQQAKLEFEHWIWVYVRGSVWDQQLPVSGLAEELALECSICAGHARMLEYLPQDDLRALADLRCLATDDVPEKAWMGKSLQRLLAPAIALLGKGLVIVVDDLARLDELSIQLLGILLQGKECHSGQLKLVVTHSGDEQLPQLALWQQVRSTANGYLHLSIPPLKQTEVRVWLENLYGHDFVRRETAFVKALHRAAGSSPLAMTLLINHLSQRGVPRLTAQGWVLSGRRPSLKHVAHDLQLELLHDRIDGLRRVNAQSLPLFCLLRQTGKLPCSVLEQVLADGFPLEKPLEHPAVHPLLDMGLAVYHASPDLMLELAHDALRQDGILPISKVEELSLCQSLRIQLSADENSPFLHMYLLAWEAGLKPMHRKELFYLAQQLLERHGDRLFVLKPAILSSHPDGVHLWNRLLELDPPCELATQLHLILMLHHRRQGHEIQSEHHFDLIDPGQLNLRDRQLYLFLGQERASTHLRCSQRFEKTIKNDKERHNLLFNEILDLVADMRFSEATPKIKSLLKLPLSEELYFRTNFYDQISIMEHTPISESKLKLLQMEYEANRNILGLTARHDILDWMGFISHNYQYQLHNSYLEEHLDIIHQLSWNDTADEQSLREGNLYLLYNQEPLAMNLFRSVMDSIVHQPNQSLRMWALNYMQVLSSNGRVDLAYSTFCLNLAARHMQNADFDSHLELERVLLCTMAGRVEGLAACLADLPLESLASSPHFGPRAMRIALAACALLHDHQVAERLSDVIKLPFFSSMDRLLWQWCASCFQPVASFAEPPESDPSPPWFHALPLCEVALTGQSPALAARVEEWLRPGIRSYEQAIARATVAHLAGNIHQRDQLLLDAIASSMVEGLPGKQLWINRLFPDFHLDETLKGLDSAASSSWRSSLLIPGWEAWPPDAHNTQGQWELALHSSLPGAFSLRETVRQAYQPGTVTLHATQVKLLEPVINIRLLGRPTIFALDGSKVEVPRASWRLLGWLLCHGRQSGIERQELIHSIYAGFDDLKRSQLAFAQLLMRLKRALAKQSGLEDWIQSQGRTVELASNPRICVDRTQFHQLVLQTRSLARSGEAHEATQMAHEALKLYEGPLLDGVDAPWIDPLRANAERDLEWLSGFLHNHYSALAPALAVSIRQRAIGLAPHLVQVPVEKWGK